MPRVTCENQWQPDLNARLDVTVLGPYRLWKKILLKKIICCTSMNLIVYPTREDLSNKCASSSQSFAPKCLRKWRPAGFQILFWFCHYSICNYRGEKCSFREYGGRCSRRVGWHLWLPAFPLTSEAQSWGNSQRTRWQHWWQESLDPALHQSMGQRWGNWIIRPSCLSLRSNSVCDGPWSRCCGSWVTQEVWLRGTFWWIPFLVHPWKLQGSR